MSEEEFEKAREDFNEFDVSSSGFITKDDLKTVFASKGDPKTDAELDLILSILDPSGDGKVTFEEFVNHRASQIE